MKKISIILACVIVAITGVLTPLAVNGGNTVTAEATEGVVAVYAAAITTETTAEQEGKTTKKSSKKSTKKVKPYKAYIKVKKAKIRNKPSKKAKVVKKYSKGKKVTVTAKHGKWLKVGKNKWVFKKRVSKKNPFNYYEGVRLEYSKRYSIISNPLTRSMGVKHYNGHRETWYSTSEYGQSTTARAIPGKHVAEDGTIRDKDGYICVATHQSWMRFGSRLMTSLGPGKVYDCGCAYGTVDIYTTW